MGKYFLYILTIFLFICFFSPQKVHAATPGDIVINEIYPNPKTGEVEWIELLNKTDLEIDLVDFTIEDGSGSPKSLSSCIIEPNDYLVLLKGSGACKFGFSLNNDGDLIRIIQEGIVIDEVEYGLLASNAPVPIQGESIARVPDGCDSGSDAADFVSQTILTQGTENPSPVVDPPPLTPPIPPTDLEVETKGKIATFTWINPDLQDLTFEIVVIDEDGVAVIDHEPPPDVTKMEYQTELDWGSFKWQIIASNGNIIDDITVDGPNFELIEPVYSKNIIINETLPHPSAGTDNEFIELYNSGSETVDLSGWFLDDAEGGSAPYEIPIGTIILAKEYLVFNKVVTKLSLSDSGDSARLLNPNNTVASFSSYVEYASIDLAWAKDAGGDWQWTEKPTPGAVNHIYLTPEDDEGGMGGEDIETIIINTIPIEIATGNFRDFGEKLVAVTGTVIATSGNTFYLDDGSGQAKIYIQDKTEIIKPTMHKGDIFAIRGIVNLYRNTWRILPQKQDDVKLIKCIKRETASIKETAVASTESSLKISTTPKTTAQARAPTISEPIIKEVKAATDQVETQENSGNKTPLWLQLIKLITGLAIVFVILLLLKVKTMPRVKIVGGRFGQDDT